MQFARGSWCKGGNLTIRVEPCEHSPFSQNGTYPFHFFIDVLFEYQLSPHATDEHSQIRRGANRLIARLRRSHCPIYQLVEIGSHEASVHSLRQVSSKRNALFSFVDRQNRPYQWVRAIRGEQAQWEEQPCSRETLRMLTEVGFIHWQGQLAI